MQTSALFGGKKLRFFRNLECFRIDMRGGVELVQAFCGHGERGQFFVILCRHLLWMAPYSLYFVNTIPTIDMIYFKTHPLAWLYSNWFKFNKCDQKPV